MKLTILGCGTSTGVPVIGCRCGVCVSAEPRNSRTRASLLMRTEAGENILIDTSTDLRAQCLKNRVERIDAVLFTHPHADHIHGIDELRAFNMMQDGPIPCYGNAFTIKRIRVMFDYIFEREVVESWRPRLSVTPIDSEFTLFGKRITPVEIYHGATSILGYRVGNAAYLTDCSRIPPESIEKLLGLDVLIIGALRHKAHPTHMNVDAALATSALLKPKRTLFTHLSHSLDYHEENKGLPDGVELAYDGMEITLD